MIEFSIDGALFAAAGAVLVKLIEALIARFRSKVEWHTALSMSEAKFRETVLQDNASLRQDSKEQDQRMQIIERELRACQDAHRECEDNVRRLDREIAILKRRSQASNGK